MQKIVPLLILLASFAFGLTCINNPLLIARLIARWFRFISGNSLETYKRHNAQINEVSELLNQPNEYMTRFPNQIASIRRTGYIAILVAVIGACIFALGG